MAKGRAGTGRRRVRAAGIKIGEYPTGRYNAITDVAGVRVGHTTIVRGEGDLIPGVGPVRTGVTAILPNGGNTFEERVVGGAFILNGAGEVSGLTQVVEWGVLETPILLTNTLSVGPVSEGAVEYLVSRYPGIGRQHDVVIPIVGECDDSWLNDSAGRHVRTEHVFQAIEGARSGAVPEGSVGGGTGMITCDFAGGIGTSSRRLPAEDGGFVVGVLVMSNFGIMRDLRVNGLPVGRVLEPELSLTETRRVSYGSIIAVVATDAPLLPLQVQRLCKRVALGIGRAGSCAHHGSGEIVIGFSTGNVVPREKKKLVYRMNVLHDDGINPLYRAAVECTEEAILNALFMSGGVTGQSGHTAPPLPIERVVELVSGWTQT